MRGWAAIAPLADAALAGAFARDVWLLRVATAIKSLAEIDIAEKRKAQESLEAKLLEGLRSPKAAFTPAEWSAIRTEALERIASRKLAG